MKVLEELRNLESFFLELQRKGTMMSELYEQVQSCGMVLPRLYLLVTVGSVYIKSRQAPAKDILKDLVEMSKGVQHPMRGLFLRNYLAHVARDKLPDVGSEYAEGGGGTVHDSLEFVLQNFSETNRLWVRMQSQGGGKKKREKERQDLRILVGTNLVRISQLEGVDVQLYKETVLPRILEQVANCKDTIAQSYLMDCIIQVFPDEFHLATLDAFLQTCTELKEKVSVRTILESMMDRLSMYADGNPSRIPAEVNAFQVGPQFRSLAAAPNVSLTHSLTQYFLILFPAALQQLCAETPRRAHKNAGPRGGPAPPESAPKLRSEVLPGQLGICQPLPGPGRCCAVEPRRYQPSPRRRLDSRD